MRGVVIANNVNFFVLRGALVDEPQKTQPLYMAMALGALAKHFSGKYIECRIQR